MPRILIVDDEGGIRSLLSAVFTLAGFEVRTAASGAEAIEICSRERFDVVLTDVVMPGMNGHDLVQRIVREYPGTRTVLMSGFNEGCDACPLTRQCRLLPKPFRPSEAVSLVEELLAQPLTGG
jgi:DNA-binding NtrC family response regulator